MGQFEDSAVQQALSDIARQGQIAQQGVAAQAVGAGAFGGSRQAVAEQELQRNILEQQGRTAAQMRQAGFESATQRAQAAFEAQQGRAQQAAQLTGALLGRKARRLGFRPRKRRGSWVFRASSLRRRQHSSRPKQALPQSSLPDSSACQRLSCRASLLVKPRKWA
jgi:hypothetical protein